VGVSARWAAWAAAFLGGLAVAGAADAAKPACDRACLTRAMDGYIAAAVSGRVASQPFARNLNSRENTLAVAPDQGVWRTLARRRAGQIFADPARGNVVFVGVFDNRQGGLTPIALRLKLAGGRIVETEAAYNTTPGRYFHPEELLEPDILYTASVPLARRSSREALARIGHLYMQGIADHSGARVPMGYRCDKYYLGGKVTNTGPGGVGNCVESFNGVRAAPPADRRILVVDEALGIVVVSFLMPNGYKDKPDSTYEIEVIKAVDGKIRSVEEFGNVAAYPPASGFGGDPATNDKTSGTSR
jgi:hypothetical protein